MRNQQTRRRRRRRIRFTPMERVMLSIIGFFVLMLLLTGCREIEEPETTDMPQPEAAAAEIPETPEATPEEPETEEPQPIYIEATITYAEEPEPTEEQPPEEEPVEEDPLANANRLGSCSITHYCAEPYAHICGYGIGLTASGRELEPYLSCAVDPNEIPLGSTVILDYGDGELHYYRADDTGGAVEGNHIDLAVETHAEALSLGMKTATVYWIAE